MSHRARMHCVLCALAVGSSTNTAVGRQDMVGIVKGTFGEPELELEEEVFPGYQVATLGGQALMIKMDPYDGYLCLANETSVLLHSATSIEIKDGLLRLQYVYEATLPGDAIYVNTTFGTMWFSSCGAIWVQHLSDEETTFAVEVGTASIDVDSDGQADFDLNAGEYIVVKREQNSGVMSGGPESLDEAEESSLWDFRYDPSIDDLVSSVGLAREELQIEDCIQIRDMFIVEFIHDELQNDALRVVPPVRRGRSERQAVIDRPQVMLARVSRTSRRSSGK